MAYTTNLTSLSFPRKKPDEFSIVMGLARLLLLLGVEGAGGEGRDSLATWVECCSVLVET